MLGAWRPPAAPPPLGAAGTVGRQQRIEEYTRRGRGWHAHTSPPRLTRCETAGRFTGDRGKIEGAIEQALRSPALGESPAGEGELRLELAKQMIAKGDRQRAREELDRATRLLPADDEARAEADSLQARLRIN
ncbi:MAG TPA: hypothetical protein VMJ70_06175 [Candidatus Sulfotelmatobacter sp.]|nr:hypothetical protein [Candidatus Sulfotelmatobacter sp.]